MNWREEYRNKRMDAAQALEAVRSGDHVWIQSGCGTPSPLVDALVARAPELHNVEIIHMKTLGDADYTKEEYNGVFRHRGLFLGDNVREAVVAGRADYTPIFLGEIEGLFTSGSMPLDVVLMQVSPPDDHGYVTLGTTIDCTLNATRCARTVIAEVNERMPRTHGETAIHVNRISAIVETSRPLLELHPEPFTAMHRRIAENVASDSRWSNAANRDRWNTRRGACLLGRQARSGNTQRAGRGWRDQSDGVWRAERRA
jgi:acyl-CoA hydrolase